MGLTSCTFKSNTWPIAQLKLHQKPFKEKHFLSEMFDPDRNISAEVHLFVQVLSILEYI